MAVGLYSEKLAVDRRNKDHPVGALGGLALDAARDGVRPAHRPVHLECDDLAVGLLVLARPKHNRDVLDEGGRHNLLPNRVVPQLHPRRAVEAVEVGVHRAKHNLAVAGHLGPAPDLPRCVIPPTDAAVQVEPVEGAVPVANVDSVIGHQRRSLHRKGRGVPPPRHAIVRHGPDVAVTATKVDCAVASNRGVANHRPHIDVPHLGPRRGDLGQGPLDGPDDDAAVGRDGRARHDLAVGHEDFPVQLHRLLPGARPRRPQAAHPSAKPLVVAPPGDRVCARGVEGDGEVDRRRVGRLVVAQRVAGAARGGIGNGILAGRVDWAGALGIGPTGAVGISVATRSGVGLAVLLIPVPVIVASDSVRAARAVPEDPRHLDVEVRVRPGANQAHLPRPRAPRDVNVLVHVGAGAVRPAVGRHVRRAQGRGAHGDAGSPSSDGAAAAVHGGQPDPELRRNTRLRGGIGPGYDRVGEVCLLLDIRHGLHGAGAVRAFA
mmetsp:Transcript_25926/g.60225  ORF Transcript_25926/g.60225 Transcript_25926/m.60225 type:complete len:490 (+) Transcript_25926:2112-3581(+)